MQLVVKAGLSLYDPIFIHTFVGKTVIHLSLEWHPKKAKNLFWTPSQENM